MDESGRLDESKTNEPANDVAADQAPDATDVARWDATELESLEVGPLPVVRSVFAELGLAAILARHLPPSRRGRKRELPAARLVELLVLNLVVARQPLYRVPAWLAGFAADVAGWEPAETKLLNDDRIGRALDHLFFKVDAAALATDVVTAAVRRYDIRLKQLHNDSTTVSFTGRYHDERRGQRDKEPPVITHGYNKDHRPDLKQLVFELSTSADGAVPIHFRVHDGNTSDSTTHVAAWKSLEQLVGSADFLYVADSKLAASDTMTFIDSSGGRFVSILPRTRAETAAFRARLAAESVPWTTVLKRPDPKHPQRPDTVYEGVEGAATAEGFRLLWYRSSQKRELDCQARADKLHAAKVRIGMLEESLARGKPRDEKAVAAAAQKLLDEFGVEALLSVRVETHCGERFEQVGAGRPGANTVYRKVDVPFMTVQVEENPDAIADAARADGVFPLVTNDRQLTLTTALRAYKDQPLLERRHEQFKNALAVAPMHLKAPPRVAALLTAQFLALLTLALIEREVRRQMRRQQIDALPLYPEARLCKQPTAEVVLDAFRNVRRHRLRNRAGQTLKTFHDPLAQPARRLLSLLDVDSAPYGPAPRSKPR